MTDLVDAHDAALRSTGQIVAGVEASQLPLPTPCTDFDVRALLGHLVDGNHRFLAVAQGAPAISVPLGTEITDEWVGAYESSAAAVGDAWRDPAALGRTARLPIGDVPGVVALGIHVVELVVHGWDLAKTTGQPTEISPTLCAIAWEHAQGVTDQLRGPGRPFGGIVDRPSDASPTDELVAWLGRRP